MPKIAELASHIIDIVAEELDVPKESILSKSRKAEIVDARHMAAKLLHARNIYPSRIAEFFGVLPRSIHYVITSFDARIQTNRMLRNSYAKLAKSLGENCETTAK
jgi:chromosomal replication initiation ATPase DnaA